MSEEDDNQPQPKAEQEKQLDSFTLYKKDPRLGTLVLKNQVVKAADFNNALVQSVLATTDEEEFINHLRRYKRDSYQKIIATLEDKPLENREEILNQISQVAEEIVIAAYKFSERALTKIYGMPSYLSSYKQTVKSNLALILMGKMGSRTISYDSDIDLIFAYSARGETTGADKKIDNGEYFVKLAQRLINALSLMTVLGRCYQIDTELRPSGNMGTLVTSYDHFLDHQMNHAQNWERLALVRARTLSEDKNYETTLTDEIKRLCYDRPLPADFFSEMHSIRQRVIHEKCHESAGTVDIKLGAGSLMDIEFVLFGLSLKHGRIFPNLAKNNIFDILRSLKPQKILSTAEISLLSEATLYFRTLPALSYVITQKSNNVLDFAEPLFNQIAERLRTNSIELKEKILHFRGEVLKIYARYYG